MDKELKLLFESIDSNMTELFHSGLNLKQMNLVKEVSKQIAKLYSEVEPKQ